jgi:argonaute-like protein implicated in RNA metabolism and viral defense
MISEGAQTHVYAVPASNIEDTAVRLQVSVKTCEGGRVPGDFVRCTTVCFEMEGGCREHLQQSRGAHGLFIRHSESLEGNMYLVN